MENHYMVVEMEYYDISILVREMYKLVFLKLLVLCPTLLQIM